MRWADFCSVQLRALCISPVLPSVLRGHFSFLAAPRRGRRFCGGRLGDESKKKGSCISATNRRTYAMSTELPKILIFDTTLRDGEQSPGATMTLEEKLEV